MGKKKKKKKFNPRGTTWDELERQLFTPEEIAESDRRVKEETKRIMERQRKRNG